MFAELIKEVQEANAKYQANKAEAEKLNGLTIEAIRQQREAEEQLRIAQWKLVAAVGCPEVFPITAPKLS